MAIFFDKKSQKIFSFGTVSYGAQGYFFLMRSRRKLLCPRYLSSWEIQKKIQLRHRKIRCPSYLLCWEIQEKCQLQHRKIWFQRPPFMLRNPKKYSASAQKGKALKNWQPWAFRWTSFDPSPLQFWALLWYGNILIKRGFGLSGKFHDFFLNPSLM